MLGSNQKTFSLLRNLSPEGMTNDVRNLVPISGDIRLRYELGAA
jgi:hypothetical protein